MRGPKLNTSIIQLEPVEPILLFLKFYIQTGDYRNKTGVEPVEPILLFMKFFIQTGDYRNKTEFEPDEPTLLFLKFFIQTGDYRNKNWDLRGCDGKNAVNI